MQDFGNRIWQMPCDVIDVVLSGAFDWRELLNLLPKAVRARIDCRSLSPCCVTACAHRESHEDGLFARCLERQLDLRFAETRADVAECDADGIADLMNKGIGRRRAVHLLWAMARDTRDEVRAMASPFARQIRFAAFREFLGEPADFGATA